MSIFSLKSKCASLNARYRAIGAQSADDNDDTSSNGKWCKTKNIAIQILKIEKHGCVVLKKIFT